MIGFKLSGRAIAFAAASIFALGLVAATPQEAQAGKTGNFLLGAAAGAAGLAIVGGLARNNRRRNNYYQPRPARRYYRPAPRRYYAPRARYAAWSNAWYNNCARRYRSFNPNTGYYTAYSGVQKFCY